MKFIPILVFLIGTLVHGQRSDFNSIEFHKADSIALRHKGASLKNLPVLVHNLTINLPTEVEKFRAIYTWVCTNIENDYSAYQKTLKKRKKLLKNPEALTEWNDSFTPKVFNKLLNQRKTACTGYAFLIRELANLAGINCKIINGYGRTPTLVLDNSSIPNHSWNAVKLDDKWYLCDPTWSAGRIILQEDGPKFEPEYFDGYFLAEPELFIKNHYPLEISSSLLEEPPTFEEFILGPVVYKEAFSIGVFSKHPSRMHLETIRNEQLSFTLIPTEGDTDPKLSLVLNNGAGSSEISPEVKRNQNEYVLSHTFAKSGRYDIHIRSDDTIIATYVVKVKRK